MNNKRVCILRDPYFKINGFNERFIEVLEFNRIQAEILDINDPEFWKKIIHFRIIIFRFLIHDSHLNFSNTLLPVLENQYKKVVYPNQNTSWHYDDKIKQYYLFTNTKYPFIDSYVFWEKDNAIKWAKEYDYPVVFKLKGGAGSAAVILVKRENQAVKLIKKMFSSGTKVMQMPFFKSVKFNDFSLQGFIIEKIRYIYEKTIGSSYKPHWQLHKDYVYFQKFLPNNDFDTRVTIIGNRAFAFRRFNRKNDFRSSGSGIINYDINAIDLEHIKIAFEISQNYKFQSMAYDFLYDENGNSKFCEISYTFQDKAVYNCPGYWDNNLNWHEGHFWPQYCILIDLLEDPGLKQPGNQNETNIKNKD